MTTPMQKQLLAAAEDAKRQDRLREIANGVQLALQMIPPGQIIEVSGDPSVEHLKRPTEVDPGGMTLTIRVSCSPIAYRLRLGGNVIDQLHELLHSDPPAEELAPDELEPAEAASS